MYLFPDDYQLDDDLGFFNYNMSDLMKVIARHLDRLVVLRCLDPVSGVFSNRDGSEFIREVELPSLERLELYGFVQSAGTPHPNKVCLMDFMSAEEDQELV